MATSITDQNKGVDPALLAKAQAGDVTAQTKLGYAFNLGQGAPQDYAQAFAWYRKAADQGDAKAQLDLGILYYHGQGVTQDYTQAAIWYRKAADQGDADAQYSLCYLYYLGQGVPQDEAQAIVWCHKAADQGNTNAQNFFSMIEWGKEREREREKAPDLSGELHSYWSTTVRVDTDMDSIWLPDEERTCKTYPDDKGKVAIVACNISGSHRDHNIPVTFWGDIERNMISDWRCRREKNIFKDEFVCRAIN
ncbi:MAG: tetratricopeptide repeat protein [Terracidiphilus sp.]